MRKIQLILGIVLAAGAVIAVLFVGQLTQPTVYDVVIAIQEIPAYTRITPDMVGLDSQSVSPAVAQKYVLAAEWEALQAEGVVAADHLRPGQPIMRELVASGAEAEGLSRLAVALDDPDLVILSVPVDQDEIPATVPGDVVGLFFSAGQIRANSLVTYTTRTVGSGRPGATGGYTRTFYASQDDEARVVTDTTELELPLAKWIANGVVYRINRERRENPNYGAPGMDAEPRYIEGQIKGLDVVVHRDLAELVAFSLAHGKVRVAVLPVVARGYVEAGAFPPAPGLTWTDFEALFFQERAEVEGR